MDTMRKELTQAIDASDKMQALMNEDTFKEFYTEITEKLAMNLAINYAYKDEVTRKRIEEQMIMCSGFANYVEGVIQSGLIAKEQLVELNSEPLEAEEV